MPVRCDDGPVWRNSGGRRLGSTGGRACATITGPNSVRERNGLEAAAVQRTVYPPGCCRCLYHLPVELLPVTASDGRTLPVGENNCRSSICRLGVSWRFGTARCRSNIRDRLSWDSRLSVRRGCNGLGLWRSRKCVSRHGTPSVGLKYGWWRVKSSAVVSVRSISRAIPDVIHVATHIETDEAAPWESRAIDHARQSNHQRFLVRIASESLASQSGCIVRLVLPAGAECFPGMATSVWGGRCWRQAAGLYSRLCHLC